MNWVIFIDVDVYACSGPDFMCETCPFIAGTLEELEAHCERHFVSSNTTHKCQFCPYYACNKQ